MLLRAGCRLISPAVKELTNSSNCSGKQRHGVILKLQLSQKASCTSNNILSLLNFSSPTSLAKIVEVLKSIDRAFSLTWPASIQIYGNKRNCLHKKRVQLPQDWFEHRHDRRFIALEHQHGARRDFM